MDVRVLGAHRCESLDTGCICFLIDGKLAIDAGALTSQLSIAEQNKIEAILVTHRHYDHIRDIPGIALNCAQRGASVNVYTTDTTRATLEQHIFNDKVYPRFQNVPEDRPAVVLNTISPYIKQSINGYDILPVPVQHEGMTVGYQVGNGNGNSLFYTADTGPGLAECWRHVAPQLLIIDVTLPSSQEDFARQTRHLTPKLLETELLAFRSEKGYLPYILAVHMDTECEPVIREELMAVAEKLGAEITMAHEGMEIHI